MDNKHEDVHAQQVERDGSDVEANNEKSEPDLIDEPTITGHATNFVEDKERSRRLRWKVDLRFLPICGFVYLLNYLDRGNIGAARILNSETGDDILQTTGTTPNGYAVAVSLFSVAYAVFEVPSNWIMKRYVRPSLWLGFLLFGWGALTVGFTGIQTYGQIVGLRFLIGVFEAGFFPGCIYFISMWYPVEERSLRIALVGSSASAAGAFNGAIAYGVGQLNGTAGLEGFRWLFLVEGIITLACVPIFFWCVPDYPARARWLSEDDKRYMEDRIKVHGGGYTKAHASRHEVLTTCFHPRMMAHFFAYLCDMIPLGSMTFFAPTIVNGLGYDSLQANLMTVPPWIFGYVVCLFLAWSADTRNARGFHVAASSVVGFIGWLVQAVAPADAYKLRYGMLFLCAAGAFPSANPLSAWVTCNVPSIATMFIATAINNSFAGVGSLISQWIWRDSEKETGYTTGNSVCAACSACVVVTSLTLRFYYGKLNKVGAKDARGKERIWLL
ncbi:putative MFS transporter [Hortaea werneckii]|nr:putative MFS transporter [Hortaea werneckii]